MVRWFGQAGPVRLCWRRRCPTFRTPTGEDLGWLTVLAAPAADGWRWAAKTLALMPCSVGQLTRFSERGVLQ